MAARLEHAFTPTSVSPYKTEEKPKKKKAPKEKSLAASSGPPDGSAESRKEGEQVEKAADEWVEIEEKADADYSGTNR